MCSGSPSQRFDKAARVSGSTGRVKRTRVLSKCLILTNHPLHTQVFVDTPGERILSASDSFPTFRVSREFACNRDDYQAGRSLF